MLSVPPLSMTHSMILYDGAYVRLRQRPMTEMDILRCCPQWF